jgi:hypothetical protein
LLDAAYRIERARMVGGGRGCMRQPGPRDECCLACYIQGLVITLL